MNFRFPQFSSIPIETVVSNLSPDGIKLLQDMLQWNPHKRPTAVQALKYPYFQNVTLSSGSHHHGDKSVFNVKTAPNLSEYQRKPAGLYKSIPSKTVPSYIGSPNVDNHSIQQLQMQIDNHQLSTNNDSTTTSTAAVATINSNGALVNGNSNVIDQYLSRSRYVAGGGQNGKKLVTESASSNSVNAKTTSSGDQTKSDYPHENMNSTFPLSFFSLYSDRPPITGFNQNTLSTSNSSIARKSSIIISNASATTRNRFGKTDWSAK